MGNAASFERLLKLIFSASILIQFPYCSMCPLFLSFVPNLIGVAHASFEASHSHTLSVQI